jgi:PAS domain S-box-containing protein
MPFFIPRQSLKTKWRSLPIRTRGIIALSIPLICVVISVGAGSWLRQSVIQSEQYIERNQSVLLTTQKVLVLLLSAQSGAGGYYVTGQESFLANYRLALIDLPIALDQLKQLVQDNPSQMQRVIQISKLAKENITIRKEGVKYIEANPNTPSSYIIKDLVVRGKQKMDQVRIAIQQLEQEENRLLTIQKQMYEIQWQINTIIIWISLILSIAATAIAMKLFGNLIRDLRIREQNLAGSKNLTQAIVSNVVDSVVILDRQNQIESFNHSAYQMFGYELEEVLGHDWSILLPETPDSISKIYARDQAVATQTSHPWQTMGSDKHGKYFPVEVSISDISFDRRRILIVRDITEREQIAAKLQSRANELAELNQNLNVSNLLLAERNSDLDQFAYVASHDLKAPLRAIANLSEWIEEDLDGNLSEEIQAQMRLLRERVHRMDDLLNGLLEYSRVGRVSSQIEIIDVGQMLNEIIETLNPPPHFKFEISPMPKFQARRMLLKQVFTNLIDNAVKHYPKNCSKDSANQKDSPNEFGSIKISVIDRGDRFRFAVTDNGKGIDPKFHDKIFVVFQTLDARDTLESTGIGLAIVKKIVETEGGQIDLDSQLGHGATFSFTWLKLAIGET